MRVLLDESVPRGVGVRDHRALRPHGTKRRFRPDFVPLVVRLRERNINVVCISERGKMAQDAVRAYDQVIYVGGGNLTPPMMQVADAVPIEAASGRPTRKEFAAKTTAKKTTPKPPAKKVAKKAKVAVTEAVTASKILKAVPNLKSGEWQPLGDVAKVLHDDRLLAKSATSTKLFKKFPHHFELMPTGKPDQVRFILPPA